MSSFQINPPGVDGEYLECLNAAFTNWGDERQFKWYFRRETIFPSADLLVFREGGRLTAGSGITYRRVRLPDGEELSVGIITGSWTLPKYRGKGLFYRLLEKSVEQAPRKGAKLLLAFVTADSASLRQVRKFGPLLFPSYYCFSTESTPAPKVDATFERTEPSKNIVAEMFEKLTASGNGGARFIFPSAQDFGAQFLARPHETEVLSGGNGDFAVVEKGAGTNLLQLFLPQDENHLFAHLLAHTLRQKRKFFTFTMHEETADLGKDFGLVIKDGFLAVWPGDASSRLPARLSWKIQSGDRA